MVHLKAYILSLILFCHRECGLKILYDNGRGRESNNTSKLLIFFKQACILPKRPSDIQHNHSFRILKTQPLSPSHFYYERQLQFKAL
jgi:hypothetical protein